MPLSHIERLPTELIQPIFLSSGPNLALPLASHHLAAKLSHQRIYEAVCTQLLAKRCVHNAAHSRNQTMLFAAKWMTWEFFKSFVFKEYAETRCLCGKSTAEGCLDPQWPPDFDDATNMTFTRSHLPVLAFVKARIPVKLLCGPWTQDKIQFLRFLLWTTSMTIDWADTRVLEIAREGKRQAFRENNLEAVHLFNHNRRLGRAPNMEQIRFAILEAECNRSIIYDTMMNARSSGMKGSHWESPELDKWCQERIEAGDLKGQWLKTKLEELRFYCARIHSNSIWEQDVPEKYGYMDPETDNYETEDGT